jgi:hypothetical protein
MTAPRTVMQLVRKFGEQREIRTAGVPGETHARTEFIDPLFRALGWDVDNSKGRSPLAYREVVREDTALAEGGKRAPDYSFRIDGQRKFFVDTRKPAAGIGAGPGPTVQLRRYAWSARLLISIVTDFEEFALYDGRLEPKPRDDVAVARLMFFGFEELAAEWEKLESLISYQAVRGGSLARHAETIQVKRGTSEVGTIFLAELEQWRRALARDIGARNKPLTPGQCNLLVQKIIDGVVFLRIAEARGIEARGQLQSLLDAPQIGDELVKLFRRAGQRYNSRMFDFSRDVERPQEPDEPRPFQDRFEGLNHDSWRSVAI